MPRQTRTQKLASCFSLSQLPKLRGFDCGNVLAVLRTTGNIGPGPPPVNPCAPAFLEIASERLKSLPFHSLGAFRRAIV